MLLLHQPLGHHVSWLPRRLHIVQLNFTRGHHAPRPMPFHPHVLGEAMQHRVLSKSNGTLAVTVEWVSRCPAATSTACSPRTSRPAAARVSRSAAPRLTPCCSLHVAPCCSQRVVPYCSQRVALWCPAHRALLQPARCALLQPARRALLLLASRPAAASASHPYGLPHYNLYNVSAGVSLMQRVALCYPTRRALLPCTARALLPCPPRALSCSPRRPVATTAAAAAAARAAAAAGGGVAGSVGSAASAGGAGGAIGSARGAAGSGVARVGQRRSLPLPDDPTPQQLCEWVLQRARPGGSECAAALGAGESVAALGASEFAAALGARASPAIGPSSAEALHTFTLDLGVSRCFFRDCTILTPLAAPILVSLADPTGGPVVARASRDVWVDTFIPGGQRVAICTCSRTGRHLATFTRRPGSSMYTLTTASAQVAEAGYVTGSNFHSRMLH
ncbi:unnamed protein product [Closterium sp. NIES-54]